MAKATFKIYLLLFFLSFFLSFFLNSNLLFFSSFFWSQQFLFYFLIFSLYYILFWFLCWKLEFKFLLCLSSFSLDDNKNKIIFGVDLTSLLFAAIKQVDKFHSQKTWRIFSNKSELPCKCTKVFNRF